MKRRHIEAVLKVGLGAATLIATLPVAHAQEATQSAGLEQVFVTARKRDEGVQAVPISIAALSAEALDNRNVHEMQDLNSVVPGFRFSSEGGKGNTDIILRGLSKIPLGEGIPSVVTYFANVALPARGSNIPTYDIANIQVLKGPQGTLFGRNTLGGAVVVTPEAPNYELGGYIKGAYGTKDYRSVEGAVNVPLVDQKAALRIAGQIRRQDGLNKNLSIGPDFDDIHQNSYRISLLLQPTESIESTTVYDHFEADEVAAEGHMIRTNQPALDNFDALFGSFGLTGLAGKITDYLNRGNAAGIHSGFTDVDGAGFVKRNLWGISNDTSWDAGFATIRNVIGYRRVEVSEAISSSGTGPILLDSPGGPNTVPFVLFDAAQVVARKYLSDEFQVFGNAFDDRLDWIVGAFYNKDSSTAPQGTLFTAFSPFAVQSPAVTSHVRNENKAVFGQIGLDISQWTVEGLKFNAGARYSKDDVWACGGSLVGGGSAYLSEGQCDSIAKQNLQDGVGSAKNDGHEVSWTMGFDWQINPDTLVYLTSRHGYRGVNVNTPIFETPFTTGGTPAQVAASPLAALGPCISPATQAPTDCPNLTSFQKTGPEKLTDVEIGVKNDWAIGDVKGRANIAAYISKYKDAVQFVNAQALGIPAAAPDTPNSGSVGVNAADLTIKGVEADFTVIPVPSLTLSLSAAYTDQKIDKVKAGSNGLSLTKDEITLPSPKFSGSFAFNWILPVQPLDGDLVLNGDYYHTDKFGGQGGENLPGYNITNFRLGWNNIAKSTLDVAFYVKNAFDEEYWASPIVLLQSFPMSVAIPGDPRTWGVEASYKF
ncbi:MAG: TonB-dependent receptor [Verrucomicrobiaceae bacterium]|nr:TonB-dependent receptor [Verrucomicrobiaceae bacterium]